MAVWAVTLNLLLAAIVVWNTVHLQACLRRLRVEEYPVDDATSRFSPRSCVAISGCTANIPSTCIGMAH